MHASRLNHALLALASALCIACGASADSSRFDPALDGLSLQEVNPGVVLPGSILVLEGRSFVGAPWGTPELVIDGQFDNGDETYEVRFRTAVRFIDLETLEVDVDDAFFDLLGSNSGEFSGSLQIDIESVVDSQRHSSSPLAVELSFRSHLTPSLESLVDSGPIYVNDHIAVTAEGLLLGGAEGESYAEVTGCFVAAGVGACIPVDGLEIPLNPASPFNRSEASFVFSPKLAGIEAGRFEGDVKLLNRHASERLEESASHEVLYELSESTVFSLGQSEVSLGQYIDIEGAGFVATGPESNTILELTGEFTPSEGRPTSIDLILVPSFVEGRTLRYTINEDDALGQLLDLRSTKGTLSGTLVAQVSHGGTSVSGQPLDFSVGLAPVKQVVFLNFTPQYVDALRAFGLRATDAAIRERVLQAVGRDYRTVNVDLRLEEPSDFSLYSIVDIGGFDPNGLGLLGYDNTPGKDSGNERLHDHIGGVNASTQEDGFPGYGGVFIESLFIFSEHPGDFAPSVPVADPLFDEIFDSFRPDRGGSPVRAADLAEGVAMPPDGFGCPATERSGQIGCASWTLANLISSTISHEIGHSLGLANPDGGDSHHAGNAPNRLMDSGSSRPFDERAELRGAGPGEFCGEAYAYLRRVLPTDEPDDIAGRPDCF